MADETPEQVTLDDLPPTNFQRITGDRSLWVCDRCGGAIVDPGRFRFMHERWHAAIEDLTVTISADIPPGFFEQGHQVKVNASHVTTPRWQPMPIVRINPEGDPAGSLFAPFERLMQEGEPIPTDPTLQPETENCDRHRKFINEVWQIALEAGHQSGSSVIDFLREQLAERRSAAASAQTDQPTPVVRYRWNPLTAVEQPTVERIQTVARHYGCRAGEDVIDWIDLQLTEYRELRERTRGLTRGEVERLRRIEDALVKAGAPNRSERGDPGGLVVRWIERRVQEMAGLREENKGAGRAIEALAKRPTRDAYNHALQQIEVLEWKQQDCERLHTPLTMPPSSTVTTVDNDLAARSTEQAEDVWCEICKDSFRLSDHYHCPHCKRRTSMMGHPNGCPAPDVEEPAEAEVCPSLYLTATGHLVACVLTKTDDPDLHSAMLDGHRIAWREPDSIPSPWPLDQEPPAGINLLRDTGVPCDGEMPYLLRAEGWRWSQNQDGTDMVSSPGSWATVTIGVTGDLIVVRP